MIDWTKLGDAESAKAFGDRLLEAPRSFADRTSISGGIDFAMTQFERAPYEGARRTIDISGDGNNNAGRDVTGHATKPSPKASSSTVSSSSATGPMPSARPHQSAGRTEKYYRDNVIGGPGAFVIVAQNFNSFGEAILNKLIAEVALAREQALRRAAAAR